MKTWEYLIVREDFGVLAGPQGPLAIPGDARILAIMISGEEYYVTKYAYHRGQGFRYGHLASVQEAQNIAFSVLVDFYMRLGRTFEFAKESATILCGSVAMRFFSPVSPAKVEIGSRSLMRFLSLNPSDFVSKKPEWLGERVPGDSSMLDDNKRFSTWAGDDEH